MQRIVEMEFGSPVYGTNLPTSDKDYKAIYLPTARDIVLGQGQKTIAVTSKIDIKAKNTAEDVEWEMFALKEYMRLLLDGQTVALTMLFMPEKHIISKTPLWEQIVENKTKWLHRGVSAYVGYCRGQANKYGIRGSRVAASRLAMNLFEELQNHYGSQAKLRDHWDYIVQVIDGHEHVQFLTDTIRGHDNMIVRMLDVCNRKVQEHITVKEAHKIYKHVFDEYGHRALLAEKNEGVDWKATLHAIRVAGEAKELLLTGHITYPRPDAEYLLKVRKGEIPYKEVGEKIEQGLEDVVQAGLVSVLPEQPDHQFAEDFVYSVYRDIVKGE